MSFRILNQAPQYLLADGSVNNGGKLAFYETDLTTPKNTWADETLSTLNSNPVIMDAAGRTLTDVWGDDGEYGIVMLDADDNVIWTRNNVRASDAAAGATIPALEADKFLTNDGSQMLWDTVRQVPDPAGHVGQALFSDGAQSYWAAPPTVPDLPADGIENTTTTIRVGTTLLQAGTGTFPASGGQQSSVSVTFGEAFSAAPVSVVCQLGPSASMFAMVVVNSISATGFSASIDTNLIGANIVTPQGFTWQAFGPVTPA